MTDQPYRNLFEQQVDLTRALIALHRSMDMHIALEVMPHLDIGGRDAVRDLLEHLREEDAVDPDLLVYLDTSIHEVRNAIKAGKIIEQLPIPGERLFGCTEAFDTKTSYTPAAKALQAALPPMERLQKAAQEAHELAEAIRLSLKLVEVE
jgi:hypothetical protein